MRIGFLITARCNASCAHCTVNSGPQQTASLPTPKIRQLMDEAAAIWRTECAPGEELAIGISGGEPFLDFPRLVEIVAHGAGLGATMTCVSNGYWAVTDERAGEKARSLKEAGLSILAISTSRFHQPFVKVERVERALRVAREAGLRTGLKCAITSADRGREGLAQWAKSLEVDQLEIFPVMPYLREGAVLPENSYIRRRGLPRGRCPAANLAVREDGSAYTCCQPGGLSDFLKVGNVFETELATLHDRFYLQGVQQVLRDRGPIHFAQAVMEAGEGHRLRGHYESVCDLCAHIASDPALSQIAQPVADAYAEKVFERELRRVPG